MLLLGIYAVVIAAGDSRAWSGSDAGGKAATVAHMVQTNSWNPDVGYWAAASDPEGRYHPLLYTSPRGERWYQVTSLPLPLIGKPLWTWFGTPGLLVVPALGALLAAFASRSIALSLGASSGWLAFGAVGLGPMLFYAGDAWEHAPAVGLGLLALAIALRGPPARWGTIALGVTLGFAAILRTEVVIVGVAIAAAFVVDRRGRRAVGISARHSVVGLSIAAAMFIANVFVENAFLGRQGRVARSGDRAATLGHDLGDRIHDALLTTVGLFPSESSPAIALGVIAAIGLGCLGRTIAGSTKWRLVERALIAMAAALVAARMVAGPGFVSGALIAAPLAAVGLGLATTPRTRPFVLAASIAFPVVWVTASSGQMLAQWGGRYVLLPATLLAIVAAAVLERERSRPAAKVAAGFVAAMALLGGVWHVQRTNAFASAAEQMVAAVPHDRVVLFRPAHFGREFGAFYGQGRWLRADQAADIAGAFRVCTDESVREVDLVTVASERPSVPDGWALTDRGRVTIFGHPLVVATYVSTT